MSFDLENVKRYKEGYDRKSFGEEYVRADDYEQLLALYLHIAERVSELPGGIDDLPEVRKVL